MVSTHLNPSLLHGNTHLHQLHADWWISSRDPRFYSIICAGQSDRCRYIHTQMVQEGVQELPV